MVPKLSEKQIKILFIKKKTYFKSFVKVLLDIEGIQKENFKASMLNTKEEAFNLSDKEMFLSTFANNEQKIIRKIDKFHQDVLSNFSELLIQLIEMQ